MHGNACVRCKACMPRSTIIHTVATLLADIFAAATGRCRGKHTGADTISPMCSLDINRWRVIVPVKGQLSAKTRLHPPAGVARAALAHALALDTLTAALCCVTPGYLIVVTCDELTATFVRDQGGTVVADPGNGLNPAVAQGIDYVQRVLGPGPTAILLGDIPTLRPKSLAGALSQCWMHPRAFVPDWSGTGTVLLSSLSPRDLQPRFGAHSAHEHGRNHVRLDLDMPDLRTDVDDDETLRRALAIGVGRHTAAVLHRARG